MELSVLGQQGSGSSPFARRWLLDDDQTETDDAARVIQLDLADDLTIPNDATEIVVAASEGWVDSLAAALRSTERALPAWVLAPDIGTAATAARNGVGAVIPELDDADAAAEWVEEYDAELAGPTARAIGRAAFAGCAVIIDLPAGLDAAVGLIERYRQAGIDEVVLRGPALDDAALLDALATEFDDEEVRAQTSERQQHRSAAQAKRVAQAERAEKAQAEPRRKAKTPGRFAKFAQRQQESATRRMSDRQLTAIVGNPVGIRALMATTARRYRPERAAGFDGELEFRFETGRGEEIWTIACTASGAKARRGESPEAALHVAAKLADFLRVGTGEISAPSAVLGGKLQIRGDFGLAMRMGEMFDGPKIG